MEALAGLSTEEIFQTRDIATIRQFHNRLGSQKSAHKTSFASTVGDKHGEVIALAEQIVEFRDVATARKASLQTLSRSARDLEWPRTAQHIVSLQSAALNETRNSVLLELGRKLLTFSELQLVNGHYQAAALSNYACMELDLPSLGGPLTRKQDLVESAVSAWVDRGFGDEAVSLDMLNAYLIGKRASPQQMIRNFASHRRDQTAAQLSSDFLGGLDFVAASAYSMTNIVDYFINFRLSRSLLIKAALLNTPELAFSTYEQHLPPKFASILVYPPQTYEVPQTDDSTQVQDDFYESLRSQVADQFALETRGLGLSAMVKLYMQTLVRIRDSPELAQLAGALSESKRFFTPFSTRFIELLEQSVDMINGIAAKVGDISSPGSAEPAAGPPLGLALETSLSLGELALVLQGYSNGAVGFSKDAVLQAQSWQDGLDIVKAEIDSIQRLVTVATGKERENVAAFRDRIENVFTDRLTKAYGSEVRKLDEWLQARNSTQQDPPLDEQVALVALVKARLDAIVSRFSIPVTSEALETEAWTKLADQMISKWDPLGGYHSQDGPELPQLPRFPNTRHMRSLEALARRLETLSVGFDWPEKALVPLRQRVLDKVTASGVPPGFVVRLMDLETPTEAAIEKDSSETAEDLEKAVELTRLLLKPLAN